MKKTTSFILLILTAALLITASTRIGHINRQRREYELEPSNPFREGGQVAGELRIPNAALTVFRSLAINYLWIRADNLKNEGQYFDALHLARMICALQPNLPTVWIFNAWNMAYNISVGLPAGPERWQWVKAGYELIRDEALVYNKTDLDLYNEISWIFQHKIGGITDDDHRYYKLRLAYEMSPLVGPRTNDDVFLMAEAPRLWDQPSCAPFSTDDVIDAKAFLRVLRNSDDALSQYIYDQMMPRTRDALDAYDPATEVPESLLIDVVNDLNRMLLDEDLYNAQRFEKVTLSEETQQWLAKNLYDWELIPVHRRLLVDAYAQYLKPLSTYRLDQDAEVVQLVEQLMSLLPQADNRDKLLDLIIEMFKSSEGFPEPFLNFVDENVNTSAFQKLLCFARSRTLRRSWKIEPLWMLVINRLYGPIDYKDDGIHMSLDWRSPFAHSIYWAMRGLEYAGDEHSTKELNLRRKVYHSLQDFFHYGRIQIYAVQPPPELTTNDQGEEVISREYSPQLRIFLSQDLRMFPVAYQSTLDVIQTRLDQGEDAPKGVVGGSINLGRDGVVSLYLAGQRKLALKYYQKLRERIDEIPPHNREQYQLPLEEFVRELMKEEIEQVGPKKASDYILSLLMEAYQRYALRDDENSTIRMEWARQIHKLFNEEFTEQGDRMMLPEWGQMKKLALMDYFNSPIYEPSVKGTLLTRLEIEDPDLYKQIIAELEKQSQNENQE